MKIIVCGIVCVAVASAGLAALGDDWPDTSDVKGWRARGPQGLAELLARRERKNWKSRAGYAAQWEWLDDLIEQTAQQRGARWSGLYWYTDLEEAKAAAKAQGKPILSLRLLGNLTDEYSCANSRYFRDLLYSNKQISDYLRENFVLHWSSERPVPVVTIDFGDGRTMKRTLTGNSIHYVLDFQGRVIDALPGLYGPAAFKRELAVVNTAAMELAGYDDAAFAVAVADWHRRQGALRQGRFVEELAAAGRPVPKDPMPRRMAKGDVPDAADAAPRAVGKLAVEGPILGRMSPRFDAKLAATLDGEAWSALAAREMDAVRFDDHSTAIMRNQNRQLTVAQFEQMIEKMRRSVAMDTARNEHLLRATIGEWFAAAGQPLAFDPLNGRIYAELFLTPASDPWLGLYDPTEYSGLAQPTATTINSPHVTARPHSAAPGD